MPVYFTDFLPRSRCKRRILRHSRDYVEFDPLLLDGHLNVVLFANKVSNVEAGLLINLTSSTFDFGLVFVDLSLWETPARTRMPAFDQQALVHGGVQDDCAEDRHSELVLLEVGENLVHRLCMGHGLQQSAVLEDYASKFLEGEGRKARVVLAIEVLVEPMSLLDLEADALERLVLLLGTVDEEAAAEVIEGIQELRRRAMLRL